VVVFVVILLFARNCLLICLIFDLLALKLSQCFAVRLFGNIWNCSRPHDFLNIFPTNLHNPFQFLTLLFLRVMGATRILLRQVMFLRSENIAWMFVGIVQPNTLLFVMSLCALLGTPGAAGLDAGCLVGGGGGTDGPCAWGTDGLCDWGTDGLCAWVTNDLGTDVWPLPQPPVAEARSWVGIGTRADVVERWRMLGRARGEGQRRWGSVGRPGHAETRSAGDSGPAGWDTGCSAWLCRQAAQRHQDASNRARGTDGPCASGY
jgi:hypothetical protein